MTKSQHLTTRDIKALRKQLIKRSGKPTGLWPNVPERRVRTITQGHMRNHSPSNCIVFLAELEFEARIICAAGERHAHSNIIGDADVVRQHVQAVKEFVLDHSFHNGIPADSRITRIAAHYEEKIRKKWWETYASPNFYGTLSSTIKECHQ